MASGATVLVATSDLERANALVAAAHAVGLDPLSANAAEKVLRTSVGSAPDVIVIDAGMPGLEGFSLQQRLARTGLGVPPIIVVTEDGSELPRVAPPRGVHVLRGPDASPDNAMRASRLILLADDIEGEPAQGMKLLHGDLARSPFPTLIRALRRHGVSGTVTVHGAQISGFAVESGAPIDAWRGTARGIKAFHRLAGLSSGAYSLVPGRSTDERTIDGDPEALVAAAERDRRELRESLARLPSLDARVEVKLTPEFFAQEFSPMERAVLATAHEAGTLGGLLDAVDAVDGDIARTVIALCDRELLRVCEATGRVHVVTDAASDLLAPDADRLAIEVVGDAQDTDEATADVSSTAIAELFRQLISTGDVLAVMSSSELSATCAAARAAAGDVTGEGGHGHRAVGLPADPRVLVVDSHQLSGPLGMTAVFATRMLAAGLGIEAVARRTSDLGRRWRTMLLLPTLDAVRPPHDMAVTPSATGKASEMRWVASLEDGVIRVEEPREVANARTVLADRLLGSVDRARPVFLCLFHDSTPAEAAALRTMLRARLRVAEMWEFQMGAASARPTGPRTVGASILQPDADELEMLAERG